MSTSALGIYGDILKALNNRAGFDAWWDEIDDEIKDEIREELLDIIEGHLDGRKKVITATYVYPTTRQIIEKYHRSK